MSEFVPKVESDADRFMQGVVAELTGGSVGVKEMVNLRLSRRFNQMKKAYKRSESPMLLGRLLVLSLECRSRGFEL